VIIAWLKLRQRTLGPILDANGWAINGRVKINIPFGAALTDVATLPPGSKRSLEDPYEDKEAANSRRFWTGLIILLVIGAVVSWRMSTWPFKPEVEIGKPAVAAPAK
jgi:hypothetical protein